MKTLNSIKTVLLLTVIFLFSISSFAQTNKNYIFSIDDLKLGGYLGIGGRYSTTINSESAGFLDFKGAVTFNGSWAVGLTGSGLYYDKSLSQLTNDGTYHLYIAYGAIFVEKLFSLTDDLKLSLSISSGQGETYYQYDKDYRDEKVWSEEYIDRTTFYIFEPGIEIQYNIMGNWWIGISGTYRNTSPLQLLDADENLLRKFSGGITFKYGIF